MWESSMNLMSLFQGSTNKESFPANKALFVLGEEGKCMYVVVKGEVEIKVGNTIVATAGPGDIVGEMALVET